MEYKRNLCRNAKEKLDVMYSNKIDHADLRSRNTFNIMFRYGIKQR
jgi:hypothetical protein